MGTFLAIIAFLTAAFKGIPEILKQFREITREYKNKTQIKVKNKVSKVIANAKKKKESKNLEDRLEGNKENESVFHNWF